ncbi:MAG: phospholipase D-like domain-containing protein [Burkholderiales bacterium]
MAKLFLLKSSLALVLLVAALSTPAFQEPLIPSGKTLAATGTIELAFTPDQAADRMVINAVNHAHTQILVQAFSFTHRAIAQALINAKKRGVDVQLIADAEQTEKISNNMIAGIAAAGIITYLDFQHLSAHNKIMVIDAGGADAAVVTGSFNFTHAAQFKNAENLIILRGNPQLTAAYLENWNHHLAHASRFRK